MTRFLLSAALTATGALVALAGIWMLWGFPPVLVVLGVALTALGLRMEV